MIPQQRPEIPDFTLITKWISRKLAALLAFYIFVAQTPAPPTVKITSAAVVTGVYLVLNVIQHRIFREE